MAAWFIRFKDVEAESRFKKWLVRGNQRAQSQLVGSNGLHAELLKTSPDEFLFVWIHNAPFSFSLLLRLVFWFNARKLRGRYKLRRAKRKELAWLLMKGVN